MTAASAALPRAVEAFSISIWAHAPLFAVLESAFEPGSCNCSSCWKNRDLDGGEAKRGKRLWEFVSFPCYQTRFRGYSFLAEAVKSRVFIFVVGKEAHSWVWVSLLESDILCCEFQSCFYVCFFKCTFKMLLLRILLNWVKFSKPLHLASDFCTWHLKYCWFKYNLSDLFVS